MKKFLSIIILLIVTNIAFGSDITKYEVYYPEKLQIKSAEYIPLTYCQSARYEITGTLDGNWVMFHRSVKPITDNNTFFKLIPSKNLKDRIVVSKIDD